MPKGHFEQVLPSSSNKVESRVSGRRVPLVDNIIQLNTVFSTLKHTSSKTLSHNFESLILRVQCTPLKQPQRRAPHKLMHLQSGLFVGDELGLKQPVHQEGSTPIYYIIA